LALGVRQTDGKIDFSYLKWQIGELKRQIYGLESLVNREILSSADVVSTIIQPMTIVRSVIPDTISDLHYLLIVRIEEIGRYRLPNRIPGRSFHGD
jgi:hypothetical protein